MRRFCLFGLLLLTILFVGCSRDERKEINSMEDMKEMSLNIAVPDDIDAIDQVYGICPNATIVHQNDVLYGVRSVAEGKVDAFVCGKEYLLKAMEEANIHNVKILDESLITFKCALGISKLCEIPNFEDSLNRTVEEFLSSGLLDELRAKWYTEGNHPTIDIVLDENPIYTVHGVTFGQNVPASYISDGKLTGFDVELLYLICQRNHWGLTLDHAEYSSMLMGLSTGKYDLISANLYVSENRGENITYSVPYWEETIDILVYDHDYQNLEYNSLEELANATSFAVVNGTITDTVIKEKFPNASIQYYPTAVDCAIALSNQKVDAVVFDSPTLEYISASTPGISLMKEYLAEDSFHFVLQKTTRGEELQIEFNIWLQDKKASGEWRQMVDFWCGSSNPKETYDFSSLPETNGKISIATIIGYRPDVYYCNNSLCGMPVELMYEFCKDKGYAADVISVTFESMVDSLTTEKADIVIGCISYTDERAESVLFTDCIMEGGMGILVRTSQESDDIPFWTIIAEGLERTFVAEARWKMILSGLVITLIITFGSFVLANLLGACLCMMALSKKKWLRTIASVYDRIMQGTPMVVILMILYYVIFGKTSISGVYVAIIGFGIVTGNSISQLFYGAIKGVDRGQSEAALSIGLTKVKAFVGIVFPQAARIALAGYFSEFITLMKGTAIVGYIAVTDLTKVSDLIRSSTYDAFFPLITIALTYFLISFGILSLLKAIQKKLAPKIVTLKEAHK